MFISSDYEYYKFREIDSVWHSIKVSKLKYVTATPLDSYNYTKSIRKIPIELS